MTLRDHRTRTNMTLVELARQTGINRRILTKYESGEARISNMTLGNALKVAGVLKLTMDDLKDLAR